MAIPITERSKAKKSETFRLRPYDHRYDAALAEMWNESDDQWPGTFTDGVPLTEARVRDWMDTVGAVMRLVVEETSSEKVVAYGDLWEDFSRAGSCYVSLLNVHPEFQKRSLARRMLTAMVDWAVEHEYDRLTIGTWPSNLKAMPLYKKTGFFWQPDTNVHMENYIPAVRLIPALAEFFERHDWYEHYVRDLAQREDDMRHPETGDTPVYVLRWEADGEILEAVVDRNAQAITGLRTDDWAVYARVAESEPAQGIAYAAEWEIANHGRLPLPVTIAAAGDPGIEIGLEQSFTLQPGESRLISGSFRVAVDAPDYQVESHDTPTPKISARVSIADWKLELQNGLRYRQAVEFSTEPQVISLVPGVTENVLLQLQNRSKSQLAGTVQLETPAGLAVDWQPERLELAPEGTAAIPLKLRAEAGSFYRIETAFAFEDQGHPVSTRSKALPVVALAPGGWAAGEIEDSLIMENDFFRLTTQAKSGHSRLFSKLMGRKEAELGEELGLPFVPWDLAEQTYELALEADGREAAAILKVRSTRFPGLLVEREMVMGGAPTICVRTRVRNISQQAFEEVRVRPMSRHMRASSRQLVVPLRQEGQVRVVREHGGTFGSTDGDIPEKPESWGERWMALEQPGHVYGTVWSGEGLEKVTSRRGQLYLVYPLGELEPGSVFNVPDLYVYSGPGDWHTVQALWQRLNGLQPYQPEEAYPPPAGRHFDIGIKPDPILTLEGEVQASLYAHTTREYRVYGSLGIDPPPDWLVDLRGATLDGVHNAAPFDTPVSFRSVRDRPGAQRGRVNLDSHEMDAETAFTLIRLGTPGHTVRVTPGERTWRLENGRTLWEISPDFSGAVVRWSEAGSETNHLLTSYPDAGELSWIKPWFGGLRPVLFDYTRDEGWPGKLHQSTFQARPLEDVDGAGIAWTGLRLEATLAMPEFSGLRLALDYLTVGGSNLLKVRYRVINDSAVYRKAEAAVMGFFQVDGQQANAVLHAAKLQRKRTPVMAWPAVGSWVGVENPESGRTMAVVVASGYRRQVAMDWGIDGGHTYALDYLNVPPHGSRDLIAYYALAESLEEARAYGALAGRREPPAPAASKTEL